MTTMKENIPIPQKMDTEIADPSNDKILVDDSACVDEVANGNSSGKKRPSMEDDPYEEGANESNDVIQDVSPNDEVNVNVLEMDAEIPDTGTVVESLGNICNDEESPDTEASSNAEKSDVKVPPSQEIESKDPDMETASTPTIDLQRPVKRARTAYFLFLEDHRAETQKQVRFFVTLVVYWILL
jgi:hypothetical protein